jgi:organic radical activating enzyme
MKPDMMEKILNYIEKDQGCVAISATHHYYNEPTINPHISDLIRICHEHGVHCLMSTNGSFWTKLLPVLKEGLTNLIFSVSGWTQEIHERSHKGVKISDVIEAMALTSDYIKYHKDFCGNKMFVRVSWHDYAYNEHEKYLMKEYSDMLGFYFTSYNTGVLPLERAQARMLQTLQPNPGSPDIAERDIRTKLDEAQKLCLERKHWTCINQQRMITIDSDGYLHNCCVKAHEANKRASLFETDLEEFNRFRTDKDEDCRKCKEQGHHIYAMQQYRLPLGPLTTIRKFSENTWRYFNLGGVFPRLSALKSQGYYVRPSKKIV